MKTLNAATLILLSLTFFCATATAQKRKPAPKKPTVSTVSPIEVENAAGKVSIQIKNVTKFLYMLGGIAIRIEDLDKEAKTRTIARSAMDANQENKQNVMQAIRNLRAGIAAMEVEFRANPALAKYKPGILGISELCAQSEDLAAAGQFTESGKPLLMLVEKLADTLASLR